jgi:hypothetical protein
MTSAASDEGPSVVRQQLFSRPGAPLLHLQLVLPPDLLDSLAELLQLAQVGRAATRYHYVCCSLHRRPVSLQVWSIS